jgi:hypothetical protein
VLRLWVLFWRTDEPFQDGGGVEAA